MNSSHPAVVLSLFDTALAVVRDLARAGVRVIGLDHEASNSGFRSRYGTALRLPSPLTDEKAALERLLELTRNFREKAVLYAGSDAYVGFVSRNRERLKERFLLNLPEPGLLEKLLSKKTQYRLVESAGLPQPRAWFPEARAAEQGPPEVLLYPVLIKPLDGRGWQDHFFVKGFAARTEVELRARLERLAALGLDVIVQELIPGNCSRNIEVSGYVDLRGRLAQTITIRKIRQSPPDFGRGTSVETIRVPEVEAPTIRLLERLGLRGYFNAEFKYDERDRTYKFIEINARVWQQVSLGQEIGLHFPRLQYLELTGQALPSPVAVPDGLKWIDPFPDFESFVTAQDPRASLAGLPRLLRRWRGSIRGARNFALFSSDDLRPALHQLAYGKRVLGLLWRLFTSGRSG